MHRHSGLFLGRESPRTKGFNDDGPCIDPAWIHAPLAVEESASSLARVAGRTCRALAA